MLPDRVSNPGPLTYESGALPIALRGPTGCLFGVFQVPQLSRTVLISSSPFEIATIPEKIEIIPLILSNVDHHLSYMKQHGTFIAEKNIIS